VVGLLAILLAEVPIWYCYYVSWVFAIVRRLSRFEQPQPFVDTDEPACTKLSNNR
jgi:hypothetical protein